MIERIIAESIDVINEMHPSVRRALTTGKYSLGKHPIFKKHGQSMSFDQYKTLTSSTHRLVNHSQLIDIFDTIQQIEMLHKDELIDLAKDIVVKIWNVDKSMLHGDLTENVSISKKEEDVDDELTPEQKEAVEKRISLNMLAHGSSLHIMASAHHMVADRLNAIDQRLVKLYDYFANAVTLSSWHIDIDLIATAMSAMRAGGANEVKFEKSEDGNESAVVVAQAAVFPILVQEFAKGVVEILIMHQLSELDETTLRKVYKHADKYEDEFFHYYVGPSVWRKFIKIVPKDKMAEVISNLSKKVKSKDVVAFIDNVILNPDAATELINGLISDE
jgi:hypothetical protein